MKRRVFTYAFTPGVPPTELQLWKVGANPTDYGVHVWSERSAREVVGVYAARGNPLQIDCEHNNADGSPDGDEPQGGYARLELRAGAPWLVFDWSAFAIEQIETRQRLFLSPEYDVDSSTNEIIRLIRVSLVADAGTHHARMLATAAARRVRAGGTNMNLALLLAALQAALSADDPAVAKAQIENLIAEVQKMAGGDAAGEPAAAAAAPPPGAGAADAKQAGAADGGLVPGADEDKKKQEAQRAAARAGAAASPESIELAAQLAQTQADNKAMRVELAAMREEREAEKRVEAAGDRITPELRVFARSLSKAQFEDFLKRLPEGPADGAGAEKKTSGVRASARPANGKAVDPKRPPGELPPEDARHLARAFSGENRPEDSVEETENGGIRTTHIYRPKAAANGAGQ